MEPRQNDVSFKAVRRLCCLLAGMHNKDSGFFTTVLTNMSKATARGNSLALIVGSTQYRSFSI